MDFGFVGPSYTSPSIYQDDQECINFRPEIDPLKQAGQRGVVALYPTPGLTLFLGLPQTAEVRGLRTLSGGKYMVAVCGSGVYAIDTSGNVFTMGSLTTTTGRVGISDNGLYVMITDGVNRYSIYISTYITSSFVGNVSGYQINVTGLISGPLVVGQTITGTNVPPNTIITSVPTTGNGLGLYSINNYVSNGSVTAINLLNAGTGYTTVPSVIIANPPSGGTTATVTWNSIGVVSTTITSGGTGYTVGDIITGFGGTYTIACQLKVTTVSSGVITGVSIYTVGAYTVAPSGATSFSGGTGKGASITLTFSLNNDYSIPNGGSFYTANPALSFSGGSGTGASALANISPLGNSATLTASAFSILPATDGAFTGADVVDIVDNIFVYNRPNTQQFGSSNLLSPLSAPLQFSSKDGAPDQLVSLVVDHREIYLLGEVSSEVWVDVGSSPFPFQRIPGTSTQHGIIAKFSVSRVGNSFAYLARNQRGQGQIVMMNGYVPTRISTHAVENTLVNQNISDAIAWTYQLEGHECYVVTFPSIDLTWVWDNTTGMWHKWLAVDSNNVYHRHRGNCCATFNGLVYVGDYQNGNIYQLDPNNYTENGQEIRRLRRAPHLVSDLQRQYFEELQIQFQPAIGLSTPNASYTTSAIAGIAISGYAISGNTQTSQGVNIPSSTSTTFSGVSLGTPALGATISDVPYGTDALQKVDIISPSSWDAVNKNGQMPNGVVLWIHGGGWSGGDKANDSAIYNPIVLANYVVIATNYRLTPQGDYPNDVNDIAQVINFLLNPNAGYTGAPSQNALWATLQQQVAQFGLMVAGNSAGGYLAIEGVMAQATTNGTWPKACMNLYGPMNLVTVGASDATNPIGSTGVGLINTYTANTTPLLASPYYSLATWETIPTFYSNKCYFYIWYNTNDTLAPPTSIQPFAVNLTTALTNRVTTTQVTLGTPVNGSGGYPTQYTANHQVTNQQTADALLNALKVQFPAYNIPSPAFEGSQGVDPKAMLRWSNDGGSTWSKEHWVSIGKIGKYKNRAIWRRLGWSRDKIFEVVVTDPVFATIVSANLKATQGEN